MSWYRDSDGKIVTDEEYRNDCMECECFCQEGMVSIPCNGERTDCPYFKEVDTSEYDKEIRDKAIDTFTEEAMKRFTEVDLKRGYPTVTDCKIILREIAGR